ncbi:MAG: NADH dehydrogenase [Actinobacteria bacterium]|nr:NADH dehydrogenase [Actinomycetota bacterium]
MEGKLLELDLFLPKEEELAEEEPQPLPGGGLYDLIIIGAGPAGMTATVYAARKKLRTVLISIDLGGQPVLTSEIENYMGYQYITGQELMAKFHEQVRRFPIELAIGEEARELAVQGKQFTLTTSRGKKFTGRSVVIASGKRSRPLNVPGEKELVGRGVTYCATCDAPLFGGMDVAVIGGGNSALTAAADLLSIANRIYIVNFAPSWQGDPVLVEKVEGSDKVEKFLGYEVMEIQGKDRVSGIAIEPRDAAETIALPVQGVFIEIGLIPNSEFARGVVAVNSAGEIEVDRHCQTNVPGIFAAGDVTSVPEKQIIVAAGEGAKAALGAYGYLLEQRG